MTDLSKQERLALLIACEKLNIEGATDYTIVRVAGRFGYRIAIAGEPVIGVSDEEIYDRLPMRTRRAGS